MNAIWKKHRRKKLVKKQKKNKGKVKRSDSKRTRNHSKRVQKAKNLAQGSISSKGTCSTGRDLDEDGENRCDHLDDLTFFTDASFFTKSYKLRNEKINQDSKKSDVFFYQQNVHCVIVK